MPGIRKFQRLGFVQCTQDVNLANANYTMAVVDKNVYETGLNGSRSVVLPPVGECVGGIYTLWIATFTSGTMTVYATDAADEFKANILSDAGTFVQSIALGAAFDYLVLYSTGRMWVVLAKEVT